MADRNNADVLNMIVTRYTKARSAKDQLRLLPQWRMAERFWQADQWPAGTPATFPKPVFNLVFEFVERKIAIITGEDPRVVYVPRTPNIDPAKSDNLTIAADWQWDATQMADVYDSVLRTSALMGTGILQAAFDPDLKGGSEKGKTLWQGGIQMPEIDPENFFPGDAVERNVQRQPYIVVADEMPLSEVRTIYRDWAKTVGTNVDDLTASPSRNSQLQIYPQENVERPGTALVLKMWWKEDGQLNYAVAAQGKLLRYTKGIYEHAQYPFLVHRWYPRRKSFWGLSEFAQLLPNQESVNRLLAFLIQAGQMTGMPQRRVKQNALKSPRSWTNDPSLVLVDNSTGNGWGIDYIQPPSPSPAIMQVLEVMLQRLRAQQGMLDAITGQAPSANLNATAIAYLQQAAAVLMKPVIRRSHSFLEDTGRLWFAFWTEPDLFKTGRTILPKGGGDAIEFRGEDYADEEYDVRIETGGGDFFDMAAEAQTARELKKDGIITAEEALMATPSKAFPAKDAILQARQEAQQAAAEQQQTAQAVSQGAPSILAALGGGEAVGQGQAATAGVGETV